jgi:hypothetical protein
MTHSSPLEQEQRISEHRANTHDWSVYDERELCSCGLPLHCYAAEYIQPKRALSKCGARCCEGAREATRDVRFCHSRATCCHFCSRADRDLGPHSVHERVDTLEPVLREKQTASARSGLLWRAGSTLFGILQLTQSTGAKAYATAPTG